MPIITFWSNNEKAIGQTVSSALVASLMGIERNYKTLLISADFNDTTIENCFGAQESNKEIVKTLVKSPQINLDSGVKGLLKLADNNRVTPEIIHDYTKIIFKNRLEILFSPMNVAEDEKAKLMEQFKNIITNASRYYDYVIVDLKKGMKYIGQQEILEMSDIVVNNIDQNIKTIEKFLKTSETKRIINKMVWNICKYDKKSKYNVKNLKRTILKKQSIYETQYNTLVLEAAQEGKISELLIRLKTLKEDDENLEFMKKLQELIEGILLKYQEARTIR